MKCLASSNQTAQVKLQLSAEVLLFAVSEAVILRTLSYQEAWEMVRSLSTSILKSCRNYPAEVLSEYLNYLCSLISGQMFCIHAPLFLLWSITFLLWLEIYSISPPLEQQYASSLWVKMRMKWVWCPLSKHLQLSTTWLLLMLRGEVPSIFHFLVSFYSVPFTISVLIHHALLIVVLEWLVFLEQLVLFLMLLKVWELMLSWYLRYITLFFWLSTLVLIVAANIRLL